MKWIAIIAVCLGILLVGIVVNNAILLFSPKQIGVKMHEDGLYYRAGEEILFTGESLVYHPNGQKKQQGKIEAGKQTGPWKIWHANGQLHWEGSYKDGKKEGVWTRFDEEGVKAKESTWEEGVEQIIFELKPVKAAESPAAPTEQKQNE